MAIWEIHEFSTGINAEILPDGRWISRGYKVGEYMNSTLLQTPYSVERAIANKCFEVSKDRLSQKPTFVGRALLGNGESDWSVVAVVTSGRDEYGRSNSFYRYFLCPGLERLWVILDFIEDYRKKTGRMPIFNPSEIREKEKPNRHNANLKPRINLGADVNASISDRPPPAIFPPGGISDLQTINAMAERIANGRPVSWGYDVEAVERAELFLVIQAADEGAYQLLAQIRNTLTNNPAVGALAFNVDEAGIRAAIKGLISGSQMRPEWIKTIFDVTLQSDRVTPENWKNIFDEFGATTGIRQRNSNPQTVRLLTLRAMLLPETLPQYLRWLQIASAQKGFWGQVRDRARRNQNPENETLKIQATSQKFQQQILQEFPQLSAPEKSTVEQNLMLGIRIVLNELFRKNLNSEEVSWLLKANTGIWAKYFPQIISDMKSDLSFLQSRRNFQNSDFKLKLEEQFWSYLKQYYSQDGKSQFPIYQPYAELFEKAIDYKLSYQLSAYFWQVSQGKVPKRVFIKAFDSKRWKANIFGLEIIREATLIEKIVFFATRHPILVRRLALLLLFLIFVGNNSVRVAIALLAVIFVLLETIGDWAPQDSSTLAIMTILAGIIGGFSGFLFNNSENLLVSQLNSLLANRGVETARQAPNNPATNPPEGSNPVATSNQSAISNPPASLNLQSEAIEKFEPTRQEIQQIVRELQDELPPQNKDAEDRQFSKRIVIIEIKNILGNSQLNYASAIEGKLFTDIAQKSIAEQTQWLENIQNQWVKAISLYQQDKLGDSSGDGYLDSSVRNTPTLLKNEVLETTLFKFAKETKPALKQIISDLLADVELNRIGVLDENEIKSAIKTAINWGEGDYTAAVEKGDEGQIKDLVAAISLYQKNSLGMRKPDGVINPGQGTSRKLKEAVRQLLLTNEADKKSP